MNKDYDKLVKKTIRQNINTYWVGCFFKCDFELEYLKREKKYLIEYEDDILYITDCVNDFKEKLYNDEELYNRILELIIESETGY